MTSVCIFRRYRSGGCDGARIKVEQDVMLSFMANSLNKTILFPRYRHACILAHRVLHV